MTISDATQSTANIAGTADAKGQVGITMLKKSMETQQEQADTLLEGFKETAAAAKSANWPPHLGGNFDMKG